MAAMQYRGPNNSRIWIDPDSPNDYRTEDGRYVRGRWYLSQQPGLTPMTGADTQTRNADNPGDLGPTSGGGGGGGGFNGPFTPEGIRDYLAATYGTASKANLDRFWNDNRSVLEQNGWSYIPHDRDPALVYNGQNYDFITGANAQGVGTGWQAHAKTGYGPAGGSSGFTGGYPQGYDTTLLDLVGRREPFEVPGAADFRFRDFNPGPGLELEEFVPPTPGDVLAEPGYEFMTKEGQRALTNAASATGNLVSGERFKALGNWTQAAANQYYGDAYGRALTTNRTNNQNAADEWANDYRQRLDKWLINYDKALTRSRNAFNDAATAYGLNTQGRGQDINALVADRNQRYQEAASRGNTLLGIYQASIPQAPPGLVPVSTPGAPPGTVDRTAPVPSTAPAPPTRTSIYDPNQRRVL